MLTLYDAARCPYCARVRILLFEKGVAYDPVEIDLDDRPAWIYEKNSTGRVPVLEEPDGFVLPESWIIMEYLEERFPEPQLLPGSPAERALVRLWIERFSEFSDPYYDLYWQRAEGSEESVQAQLRRFDSVLREQPYLAGSSYTLADIGYVPWLLRAESRLGLDVRGSYSGLAAWLERIEQRPSIAAEVDLVAAL